MTAQEPMDTPGQLPPTLLYKYQSFDRRRLTSILVESRIWFGSPLAFNDPFDCSPIVDLSGSDDEFRDLASSVLDKQSSDMPMVERRRMIEEIIERGGHRLNVEEAREAWRMSAERLGVLCLTERPDDQLMWGHYSSSHSGICFGFDTTAHPFNLALSVGYSDERPSLRVMERRVAEKQNMIFSALRSKASHWRYEREWRILIPDGVGLTEFKHDALKVVLVGALASRDDEDWLLAVLRQREHPVTLLKCRLNEEKYQLEADRIDYAR